MGKITLKNRTVKDHILLSNSFIRDCLPKANGEFVKIYLYLLMCMEEGGEASAVSLAQLADALLCTERDIRRALNYWEGEGILKLTSDSETGEILEVCFGEAEKEKEEPSDFSLNPSLNTPSKELTPDRIEELKQNDEIAQFLYIAEQYLGRALTPLEVEKFLYFYDTLKLPGDVIEYLLDYCISNHHPSIYYMEKVAISWASHGIRTVQAAQATASSYNKDFFAILKALGITNRAPVESEISYMETWRNTYGFSLAIITEACARTIRNIAQPSFSYTDKILTGWHKNKVTSLDDILKLDQQHKKEEKTKTEKEQSKVPQGSQTNRFNNFQQRSYDFKEFEKRLLSRE